MTVAEFAVSAVAPLSLEWVDSGEAQRTRYWLGLYDDPLLAQRLGPLRPTHLYLGSEFCEHLLPTTRMLIRALQSAREAGLEVALLTPVASPDVIRELSRLLPLLPDRAEVVVNDWGVAAFVADAYRNLSPIAGRILCRMIKDPRLPGPDWAPQCAPALDSGALQSLFSRLRFDRVELDVPLFPTAEFFSRLPFRKGVHLPFAYVAKGRMCRTGSIHLRGPDRFAVGRECRKECLSLSSSSERPGFGDAMSTMQIGNTIFARHTKEMRDVVMDAFATGTIERLIVPGERQ